MQHLCVCCAPVMLESVRRSSTNEKPRTCPGSPFKEGGPSKLSCGPPVPSSSIPTTAHPIYRRPHAASAMSASPRNWSRASIMFFIAMLATAYEDTDRGRDVHCCTPPAQNRTCGFPAYKYKYKYRDSYCISLCLRQICGKKTSRRDFPKGRRYDSGASAGFSASSRQRCDGQERRTAGRRHDTRRQCVSVFSRHIDRDCPEQNGCGAHQCDVGPLPRE